MKKTYGAEQIIGMLRQWDVILAQGKSIMEVCRELGISDSLYGAWSLNCRFKSRPNFTVKYITNLTSIAEFF